MSAICTHFDAYYDEWSSKTGALCYLLCRSRHDALDVAFQSLLRLGGAKDREIGKAEAKSLLFKSALRLSDDYYLKKMRRLPSKKKLRAATLPFEMTDALYAFLKLPFKRRAALALSCFGFDKVEIAALMNLKPQAAEKLLADPGIPGWQDAVSSVMLTEDESLILNDRIYERFAVRSVGVENAIHDARNAFDRCLPYLALAVLLIFAFSVWFVSR